MRRRIAVVTTSRADYGLLCWTLRRIHADPQLELLLIVSGMHLCAQFGMTVREIERDGLPIAERVEMLLASDTDIATTAAMGLALIKFGEVWGRLKPDIILVLGDRFEILPAVVAALPLRIPVAHIHGGESTEGLIDEGVRHAVTKLSHLHFASTEHYARRIRQMGEAAWRVVVCGAPGVETIRRMKPLPREALEARLGMSLAQSTLLVTYHPVTLEFDEVESHTRSLLAALDAVQYPTIVTQSNADPGGRRMMDLISEFAACRPWMHLFVNLGAEVYLSLMREVSAMVGNSSSGIIEAASVGLPVVNIGERQRRRVHGPNVLDVRCDAQAIIEGIRVALSPEFRAAASAAPNPYDRGEASATIVRVLRDVPLDGRLLKKEFEDLVEYRAQAPVS